MKTEFLEDAWVEPADVQRTREVMAVDYRDEDDDDAAHMRVGNIRALLAEIDTLRAQLLAHQGPTLTDTGENDTEAERLERIHRSLATGYLVGLLHGDPRLRFVELDPERTVVRFAELLPNTDFVIRITPDTDLPF